MKNTNKKAKFTAIDALIIIAVIALIVFGAVKLLPKFINGANKKTTDFTIMVQKQDLSFAEAISIGDSVTVSLTEKDGGIVKDVKAEPATTMAYNSIDNVYSNQPIEGKYDVYVTVEAQTSVSNLSIKTGGTAIKVGSEIPVRGKGYAANGYVIEIND